MRVSRCPAFLVVIAGIGLAAPVDAQREGQAGRIRGRAVDSGTRQPLSGVAVTVLDSGLEAHDGAKGPGRLRGLQPSGTDAGPCWTKGWICERR